MTGFQYLFYKDFCPWVPFRYRRLISSICPTYSRTAYGGQMHTKRPPYLIARVQMKTDGEHIQDKRFLCLISKIQTKTYGEQILDKRLQCLIARKRTQIYVKQIKKSPLCPPVNTNPPFRRRRVILPGNFRLWYNTLSCCLRIITYYFRETTEGQYSHLSDPSLLIVLKNFSNNISDYPESHERNHEHSASAIKHPGPLFEQTGVHN